MDNHDPRHNDDSYHQHKNAGPTYQDEPDGYSYAGYSQQDLNYHQTGERDYYNADANNPYVQEGDYYDAFDYDAQYPAESYNDPSWDWDAPNSRQPNYRDHGRQTHMRNQGDYGSYDGSEVFSDGPARSSSAYGANMGDRRSGLDHFNAYQVEGEDYGRSSYHFGYGDNGTSGDSTPNYGLWQNEQNARRSQEPYPAWSSEDAIPVSKEEVEDIFVDLTAKFGFQRDSMRNMYDHLMTLLDSRASRMTPNQALLSLHADYIGGDNSNYRKWYFGAQLDLDSAGFANMKLGKGNRKTRKARRAVAKSKRKDAKLDDDQMLKELEDDDSLEAGEYRWKTRMSRMSQHDRIRQIALYLLCWGEANQVRFMPECLCFIFKCADDYLNSPACQNSVEPVDEYTYLNNVITPIYKYCRDQGYEIIDGKYMRRERDHDKIIGYDDCNQLFWYPEGLERIAMEDGSRLVDLPPAERFLKFQNVVWKKAFFKTYKETRSWFHLLLNFNRIWIIHITMFWFYTAYNSPTIYTKDYQQELNNQPNPSASWSAVALGGAISTLIMIGATLAEWRYVPRQWPGAQHLTKRLLFLIGIFIINVGPSVYIFGFPNVQTTKIALALGIVQFFLNLVTFLYFAIMPIGGLFGSYLVSKKSRQYVASHAFTSSYAPLTGNNTYMSYGLWVCVFGAKFGESYVALTLSIRDSVRILSTMEIHSCLGDAIIGSTLCKVQPKILLGLMVFLDLILFFLDTFLWYIVLNTLFSVARSFILGISILTPWKNVFSRLPKRIYSKLLATNDMEIKYKPKVLISQIWNAVVISMYREHLLSIEHVQKLLYHQVPSEQEGERTLRAPTFFVSQDDQAFNASEFFPAQSEAERRISFFAQSLSTPLPQPVPVDNMPTFTVLIPHYSEKILLSLREIIRPDEPYSRITLLEYLKKLHPHEWDCFVKDTKILAEEVSNSNGEEPTTDSAKKKIDDLPFYFIGFKSAAPEYTLRTRIWASLRSQTLYRTISGFMNYSRAIKLLYRVENPEVVQMLGNSDKLERELERMARRKFKIVVSMQRYSKFTREEMENTEFLLRAYPDLQIAYLDEEAPLNDGDDPRLFSALIDGHSEVLDNGMRRPKFRIQLSGNPILGDGKSDNQNHSLIFYRGEYIQLIDANQDNYLEECLKIRSVLAEFEEMTIDTDQYTQGSKASKSPIAILGAREYIFSENIGFLGDTAAGKEQTFGTLFARTLSQIGGKLHYGHPDFLNGIFMTTRGGVSKAQKGLHLNEDIYAGMTAVQRGGRIKHCEYYQCGKGRDLGFGSILNFVTKIGTGMGEQMLSREYYYFGTQLPLDRFLSFYYAHPGFHLNNIFIILSVQLFMICLVNLGALRNQVISCNVTPGVPITDPLVPTGCSNIDPILDWVYRCIVSIIVVLAISFVPLVVQEMSERGLFRAAMRFVKQLASLSPVFEVFVCQIYANSVQQDLSFGGARYIGTGRGFATARIPFSVLFSRFSGPSIYLGSRTLLMLLFATLTVWQAGLVYFWISLSALCMSPFIYNPHQFSWGDFFIDYRDFIRWLSRGNSRSHAGSWIAYCRLSRTKITGYKRKAVGEPSSGVHVARAAFTNMFFAEILGPIVLIAVTLVPYLFINAQTGVLPNDPAARATNSLIRVGIIAVFPIIVNLAVLATMFGLACFTGPLLSMCCKKFGSVLAAIAHGIAVLMLIVSFEVMFFLEGLVFSKALLGMIAATAIQRFIYKLLITLALTREMKSDKANIAFWTGKWYSMGWHSLSQPGREFLCKITELGLFAGDFILCHMILFAMLPVIIIPQVDKIHSIMIFWLQPSQQIRPQIYSMKQSKLRNRRIVRYAILYFVLLIVFLALIIGPIFASPILGRFTSNVPLNLYQPVGQNNNDTGGNSTGTSATPAATSEGSVRVRLF